MRSGSGMVVFVASLVFAGCSDKPDRPEAAVASTAAAKPVVTASQPAEAASRPHVGTASPRSELIPKGEMAPDFTAADHKAQNTTLSELLSRSQVVLVFYPADFTSGCTKQLCAVRDDWSKFQELNAIVLGVNPAEVEKHASFAEKYQFPFPVIHDQAGRIAAAYGCQGDRFTKRAVYVIGRDGKVKLSEYGMVPHDKIFTALRAD